MQPYLGIEKIIVWTKLFINYGILILTHNWKCVEVEYNFAISSNRILPETCPPDSRRSQASSPVVVYFVDRILRSNNGPSREWVGGNGHFETRLDVGPQYLVHENSLIYQHWWLETNPVEFWRCHYPLLLTILSTSHNDFLLLSPLILDVHLSVCMLRNR